MRPTRAGVLRLSVLLFAACSSTPPPPPPPPAEPQPPPPEAAPAAPPPKLTSIAVFDLRSVETERIPKTLVGSVSEKLRSSLTATGQVAVTGGADIPSAESCIDEACRIGLAKELSTQLVLHTRLIQYDLSCFLVAALYSVESGRSEWAFTRQFLCNAPNLDAAVAGLAEALVARPDSPPPPDAFAVVPIQHKMQELAWASESLTEYLATLLAESGQTIVPSAAVRVPLEGRKAEPFRACGDKACSIELGRSAAAEKSVATKISKRGKTCTVDATIYELENGTSSTGATSQSGCEAYEIAAALKEISAQLAGSGGGAGEAGSGDSGSGSDPGSEAPPDGEADSVAP